MIRVMIVEDEPVHREGLARHIRWADLGYEDPLLAEDAETALALAGRTPPDVALVDVRMPGMDGIELTHLLREAHPGLHVLIVSGFDEFEFARAAVEAGASAYLLKPVKAEEVERWLTTFRQRIETRRAVEEQDRLMREQWGANVEAARERFLEDLLREPMQEREPMLARARLLGLTGSGACFVLLVVLSAVRDSTVGPGPEAESLFLSRGLRALCTAAAGVSETIAVRLDRAVGAILMVCRADRLPSEEDLQERLAAATGTLRSDSLSLTVLYTPALGDLQEVQRQFCRARGSLWSVGRSGDVLPVEAVAPDREGACGPLVLPKDVVVGRVTRGQPEEALRELARALSLPAQGGGPSPARSAQVYGIDLVNRIHGALHASGAAKDEDAVAAYETLMRCRTVDDVRESLARLVRGYAEGVRTTLEHRKHRAVQAALDMIGKHYHESLTIKDLAEAVGINASYLSTLFREETGRTFSDHLRILRIGKAKELLGSTSLHVYEVAEKVGFRTLAYFTSVFRKETGLSPGEYRSSIAVSSPARQR